MKIVNCISEKLNKIKKEYYKKIKMNAIYSFLIMSLPFFIVFLLGSKNHNDFHFLLIFLPLILISSVISYFGELKMTKFLEKNKEYEKLLNYESLTKILKKKNISSEDKKTIENFCKSSILSKKEIEFVRRMILNDKKSKVLKDIDNEYLMIKFLIEIKKCEDLKKEYGSLVEKEKTLNKETLKL